MSTIVLDVIKDISTGKQQVILPESKIFSSNIANDTPGFVPNTATGDQNTLVPLPREDTDGYRWANWGADDKLPTDIRCKIMQSPMASSTVYKLVKMMYGNGLAYYRNSDLQEGNTVQRANIPAVEQWLRQNRIRTKWLMPQLTDFRFYMNGFNEMILNRRGDFITSLYHKSAEFCRLSKQNEENLRFEWLYYSSYFGQYAPSSTYIKKIHLLPWWDTMQYIEDHSSVRKFAWHSRMETPGVKYYARPYWLGLFRKNGWLDASIAVPEIVNAMMRNQIIITYQISIPESYFTIRYQDWYTYTDDERNKRIDDLIANINTSLGDTKNLYKSISTVFKQNETNGAAEGMIEIKPIGDQIKKDSWVPTSDVADAQVVQGFGLHPSQMGLGSKSGGMGAGSGSDQREGYNTEITMNTMEQDTVLEPLNFIAQFNALTNPDWDVTFFIDHTHHTTTNNQESGLAPSSTAINIE
jgi:hypothetical protein